MQRVLQALLTLMFVFLIVTTGRSDEPIRVSATVIDDATGEPIKAIMIQAGKFDVDKPGNIIWGWSETRTQSKTGRYSTTVRWHQGWTARVVVDGYLPQAIITEALSDGETKADVTLRLKRGRLLVGRVLDHAGEPLGGVSVFAIGPGGINVYGGKAVDSFMDREDPRAKGVKTNAEGKFELPIGEVESIVVTSELLDIWPVKVPEVKPDQQTEPLEITLPQPARLTIRLNIEGCEKDSSIFCQYLDCYTNGFKRVESTRTIPIANGGQIELNAMTPGKYEFWRKRETRFDGMGIGGALDRTAIELKAGQDHEINMVRERGSRATGTVSWPAEMDLSGVVVKVLATEAVADPLTGRESTQEFDIQQVRGTAELDAVGGNSRTFQTDMLVPGEYSIVVEAYTPLTELQRRSTGIVRPSHRRSARLVIPDMGKPEPVELELDQ